MSDLQVLSSYDVTVPEGDGDKKLPITDEVRQTFRDVLGVTGIVTAGMLESDNRLKEIAGNGSWLSSSVITTSASGFPLTTSVVWPDGRTGVLTAVEDEEWEGARKSWQVTYGSPPVKTLTQPAMTRSSVDGRVTGRPPISIS